MVNHKSLFLFIQTILLYFCLCDLSVVKRDKLLNSFIDYYNNLPNQIYTAEEGILQNVENIDENTYKIGFTLKVADLNNIDVTKYLKCTTTVQDSQEDGVTIMNNEHHCQELGDDHNDEKPVTTDPTIERKPVQLDNEVQSNTAVTSGEQFIAIPREEPGTPCIGCATHVNPQAAGVIDLATLGLWHLDRHEPDVRHDLKSVVDVERQVQIVNGVRYILTLIIDGNNCSETVTNSCESTKACKITILEKPWVKLPNGGKYRAILSNNCTEEWHFGDNGEVISDDSTNNNENNEIDINPKVDSAGEDVIKPDRNDDVESQQNQGRPITDSEMKNLEDQIIPRIDFLERDNMKPESVLSVIPVSSIVSKEHISKVETADHYNQNSINQPGKAYSSLTDSKKKAIEDLLNFFDFSGLNSKPVEEKVTRNRRSYDLKIISLVDKLQNLQNSIKNGKYLYTLAQTMVDYLNEMDLEVKTRFLDEVINAEEELENYQHFFYIQARVIIPCEKAECEAKDLVKKVCFGVLDGTDKNYPQVLNAFCYNEKNEATLQITVDNLPLDDPVLQNIVKKAIKKIELESASQNALQINTILNANTKKVSGYMTKASIVLDYLNCNKTTPVASRKKCKVLENLGSKVCEVILHERYQLKEHKITYNCMERPADMSFSNQIRNANEYIDDPKVQEMVQEALQYIEVKSNRNNKQKIVAINSMTTQLAAGFLTDIKFTVGYTTCANDIEVDLNTCQLIEKEPLRNCRAQIWDRTWIEEGRQVDVICQDHALNNKETMDVSKSRKKRASELLGAQEEQDANNSQYITLAHESLQQYMETSGGQQHYSLINVEKATTQIVAGTLTRISFTVSPTDCQIGTDGQPTSTSCTVINSTDVAICHSEIWERPWLNKKQINVNCEIVEKPNRKKRQALVGGPMKHDPNNVMYQNLATESLQKYLLTSGNTQSYKVIHIENVTTQVVAGSLTRINFVVEPTDENSGDELSCHSAIWERLWLNDKQITVNCQVNKKQNRRKRELVGGQTEQDPNDVKYHDLATESLQKYLLASGTKQSHKVVHIEKVTTQVVAGKLTRINFIVAPTDENSGDELKCHSEIWERPWLNDKQITVNCQVIEKQNRKKRQVLVGGPMNQDPNNVTYQNLATESLQKYLLTSGDTQSYKVVHIENVTTQVVAGSLTRINFVVAPTDENSGDELNCHSAIWERPWLNDKQITVNCQVFKKQNRRKRELVGGQAEQDPNDAKYHDLATESLQKYLLSSGNKQSHKVVHIEKVTTQVVAGSLTRINFIVAPTDENSGDELSCYSKIWEQPWLNKKQIDVNCQINTEKSRKKRFFFDNNHLRPDQPSAHNRKGFNRKQDPSKKEYKILAQDSLYEYQRLKKSAFSHKVIEVKQVLTKVVSGIIYNIDYTAAPTKCSAKIYDVSKCKVRNNSKTLYCHTRIWDQPWLHKKKITVSCNPHFDDNSKQQRNKRSSNIDSLNKIDVNDVGEEKRNTRQARDDLDYIDEDLSHYYAERAIQHVNQVANTENLSKLVTIHSVTSGMHMGAQIVRMYIEIAPTFCLRHADENELAYCEEVDGSDHRLCLAKLWPSPDDELIVQTVAVVCNDNKDFDSVTGLSMTDLLKSSIEELEKSPDQKYKLVHVGDPHMVPSLYSDTPVMLSFIAAYTNCTKGVDPVKTGTLCFIDSSKSAQACNSFIWFVPNSREINQINVKCGGSESRHRRSVPLNPNNATADDLEIQKLVQESLKKLEMASIHRYKQRVILINSYSTKITSGKVTTIDFDVGYTSCLKYEWVGDVTTCEFMEHLPRRHCVAQIFERLWVENGKNIDVSCEDDETPLEAHIEFESAEMAMQLAKEALKHIEAKYPHPRKQKVVRIFSLEKQVVAGIHYRMKVEVGLTNCTALSDQTDCKLVQDEVLNKFCRVNVWLRPWTTHPPNFRVTCDYQEGATAEVYYHLQAEFLFNEFLTTYKPDYIDDHVQMRRKFEIFQANVRKIHELNTHERGTATYGVTRFADLSYEEFTTKHLGLKPGLRDHNRVPMPNAEIPKVDIPDKFDWRSFDAVTAVKDQGSCGSCWAFSVTGNVEGQWKMQSGQLVSLSEQELVDCDKMDQGCNGGLMDNAYRAIEQLGGLEMENDYPYEGEDDRCIFNKTLSKVQIHGAVNISSNETDMAKWLVQNGPISIGINANAMQFYMGGISHPWRMLCSPSNLDHGVLLVGYGVKDYPLFHKRLPFWTIKNSWGPSWGEQGYYRVYRGDGTCGVNLMASSSVI